MNVKELYLLVEDFYGYKAKMQYMNTETKEVSCILYDAFLMKCNINGEHGEFGAGIFLSLEDGFITDFLGENCSLNNDMQSIKESLSIIDEYCQLRLPDKYLEKFKCIYKEIDYGD